MKAAKPVKFSKDTSFDFGANAKPKPGGKPRGGNGSGKPRAGGSSRGGSYGS